MTTTAQGDIMVGSVRNMVDRLSKDFTATKPPMSIHEPRKQMPKVLRLVAVTFNYKATEKDELNLIVGDIVEVLEDVEDGWSRGRIQHTGDIGVFPTNFVELKGTPTTATPTGAGTASAVFPAMTSGLAKDKDDLVIRRSSGDDKPEAIKRTPSIIGAPSQNQNAVPTVTTFSVKSHVVKTDSREEKKEMARVKFIYEPEHPDELRLGEIGALIEILRKDCGDAGWFEGELNGKTGLFPDNFVELVQVPVASTSGSPKISTKVDRPVKAPLVAPSGTAVAFPPAVPAKPVKQKLSDSTTSLNAQNIAASPAVNSSGKPVSTSFLEIKNRMAMGLKVVGPGDTVPNVLSKSTIVSSSNGEPAGAALGRPLSTTEIHTVTEEHMDQPSQLTHITKDRPRGPGGKRPASMMMLKKRSTENLLDSPTSDTGANVMSLSSSSVTTTAAPVNVVPATSPTRNISNAMRPAFKEEPKREDKPPASVFTSPLSSTVNSTLSYPSSATISVSSSSSVGMPLVNTYNSASAASHVKHHTTIGGSSEVQHNSEWVSRKEYNDLLSRFSALEARITAMEHRRH